MSDSKLRQLERRWRETGSANDESAYLLEPVRVGDLSKARLHLANFIAGGPLGVNTEAQTLPAVTIDVLARVCLAAGRRALVQWIREFPKDQRPQLALESVEEWIACPCGRHQEAVAEAFYAAADAVQPYDWNPAGKAAVFCAGLVLGDPGPTLDEILAFGRALLFP